MYYILQFPAVLHRRPEAGYTAEPPPHLNGINGHLFFVGSIECAVWNRSRMTLFFSHIVNKPAPHNRFDKTEKRFSCMA